MLLFHHDADVPIPAAKVWVHPVVEADGFAGSRRRDGVRLDERLRESMHLEGHFRVPSEDVS